MITGESRRHEVLSQVQRKELSMGEAPELMGGEVPASEPAAEASVLASPAAAVNPAVS